MKAAKAFALFAAACIAAAAADSILLNWIGVDTSTVQLDELSMLELPSKPLSKTNERSAKAARRDILPSLWGQSATT